MGERVDTRILRDAVECGGTADLDDLWPVLARAADELDALRARCDGLETQALAVRCDALEVQATADRAARILAERAVEEITLDHNRAIEAEARAVDDARNHEHEASEMDALLYGLRDHLGITVDDSDAAVAEAITARFDALRTEVETEREYAGECRGDVYEIMEAAAVPMVNSRDLVGDVEATVVRVKALRARVAAQARVIAAHDRANAAAAVLHGYCDDKAAPRAWAAAYAERDAAATELRDARAALGGAP